MDTSHLQVCKNDFSVGCLSCGTVIKGGSVACIGRLEPGSPQPSMLL